LPGPTEQEREAFRQKILASRQELDRQKVLLSYKAAKQQQNRTLKAQAQEFVSRTGQMPIKDRGSHGNL
jgi:hypothetical protein